MKAVNVHRLWKGIFTAAVLSCLLAVPASAKEERTPVGRITLNFSADIQAGAPRRETEKIRHLQPRAAAPKAAPGLHFFAFSPSDPVILWKMHG